jgi:hypothetical protein
VSAELGATPNQVVLAWLMGGQPPIILVVGTSTVAQLDEPQGAVELHLDDDVRRRLDMAGRHTDGETGLRQPDARPHLHAQVARGPLHFIRLACTTYKCILFETWPLFRYGMFPKSRSMHSRRRPPSVALP